MILRRTNNTLFQAILAFVLSFFPIIALAADSQADAPIISEDIRTQVNELNQLRASSPQDLFGTALRAMFTVIGAVVLLVIVYGGILLMTARGNSEQVQKAIKTLVWTALGTFVIFGGLALTRFVIRIFSGTAPGS